MGNETFMGMAHCKYNIALLAFCSLAVTKVAHWPMSSLLLCGSLADSLLY